MFPKMGAVFQDNIKGAVFDRHVRELFNIGLVQYFYKNTTTLKQFRSRSYIRPHDT